MRKFKTPAAQGEVNFEIISKLPEGLSPMKSEGGNFILGHSESGNHHVLLERDVQVFETSEKTPDGMAVLYALVKNPTTALQIGGATPHGEIAFNEGDIVRITPAIDFDPYAEERAIRRAAD